MSAQKVNLVTKVQGEVNPKAANQKLTFAEVNLIGSVIDSHADDIDAINGKIVFALCLVTSAGALGISRGVSSAVRTATGIYLISIPDIDSATTIAFATVTGASFGEATVSVATNQVSVRTFDASGNLADRPFSLMVTKI